MKFFYKILWLIFGEELVSGRDLDEKSMDDWLFHGFRGRGFRTYYTIRKKAIDKQMELGLENNNYWEMVGRVKELKQLAQKINREGRRREKEFKKVK